MVAAANGVFVAASAGNSGPGASTVAHNSPWLTTVAASTHAVYEGTVELGDGEKYRGASISDSGLPQQTPIVLASAVGAAGVDGDEVALCAADSLDPAKVAGTIVVCDRGVYDRVAKSAEVKRAGGVGLVLANVTPGSLDADFHSVPTVHVDETAGAKIKAYVAEVTTATAALLPGDRTGLPATPTPVIAGFSSRGPAIANGGDVLKPDISAPGVSVLAAVAPGPNDGRTFNLLSGTSMSSPHIAGLAALVRQKHPSWSPMQVNSAMMTTA
jgi:subtilisin family serine protease